MKWRMPAVSVIEPKKKIHFKQDIYEFMLGKLPQL